MSDEQKTCAERVKARFEDRMQVLRDLREIDDPEDYHREHETNLYEYGLAFDYKPAEANNRGYWCYLLSWGGPQDEFRIYGEQVDDYRVVVDRIEYWFLDWFDGAHVELEGNDFEWFLNFFNEFFVESGLAGNVRQQALED